MERQDLPHKQKMKDAIQIQNIEIFETSTWQFCISQLVWCRFTGMEIKILRCIRAENISACIFVDTYTWHRKRFEQRLRILMGPTPIITGDLWSQFLSRQIFQNSSPPLMASAGTVTKWWLLTWKLNQVRRRDLRFSQRRKLILCSSGLWCRIVL
jgi:hypothetical protein